MEKQARSSKKRKAPVCRTYPVVIEREEAGYFVTCPTLHGCSTQGDTFEEALVNIREAIEVYVESLLAENEEVPASNLVSLTTMEVQVPWPNSRASRRSN
jgi:predicted RNase H-like HicB family nuclease